MNVNRKPGLAFVVLLAFSVAVCCACAGSDPEDAGDPLGGDDVVIGELPGDVAEGRDADPDDATGGIDTADADPEDSGHGTEIPPTDDGGSDDSGEDGSTHPCEPDCGERECGPDPVCGVECGPCPEGGVCSADHVCIGFPGMAFVPAGPFQMGCNEAVETDCSFTELPYHEVALKPYFIDRIEVTVAAYRECVQAEQCGSPVLETDACHYGAAGRDDFPMNCVRWQEAADYCEWAGKRLPTEAEWEKAARGVDGRKHPWGNETADCERAVMFEDGTPGCGTDAPWAVCSRSPAGDSPYGLCDMAGNVWEWVSDWYDPAYYESSPSADPQGPDDGTQRVVRGGSYIGFDSYMRVSRRLNEHVSARSDGLGFRCAKDHP